MAPTSPDWQSIQQVTGSPSSTGFPSGTRGQFSIWSFTVCTRAKFWFQRFGFEILNFKLRVSEPSTAESEAKVFFWICISQRAPVLAKRRLAVQERERESGEPKRGLQSGEQLSTRLSQFHLCARATFGKAVNTNGVYCAQVSRKAFQRHRASLVSELVHHKLLQHEWRTGFVRANLLLREAPRKSQACPRPSPIRTIPRTIKLRGATV